MEELKYLPVYALDITVVVFMVRLIFLGCLLSKKLRNKYPEKWKYLTSVGKWGPGLNNSSRYLKFFYGKDELDKDMEILLLKIKIRHAILYIVTGMVGAFIIFWMITPSANNAQ